jgi:transposase
LGPELKKLGREVRIPANDVKRTSSATSAADAEAIREAARPIHAFVQVKSPEQQGQSIQHRTRDPANQLINALRAHLAEFRNVAAKGDLRTVGAIASGNSGAISPISWGSSNIG